MEREFTGTVDDAAAKLVRQAVAGIELPIAVVVLALGSKNGCEIVLQQAMGYQATIPDEMRAVVEEVVGDSLTQLAARLMALAERDYDA